MMVRETFNGSLLCERIQNFDIESADSTAVGLVMILSDDEDKLCELDQDSDVYYLLAWVRGVLEAQNSKDVWEECKEALKND